MHSATAFYIWRPKEWAHFPEVVILEAPDLSNVQMQTLKLSGTTDTCQTALESSQKASGWVTASSTYTSQELATHQFTAASTR